ncbi:MAG: helix-turn-helix transcriptional regulator, partial [Alphaproteobacteria bacterium]|nr:helix-turn-helix transcriptional regulator [Alphaproteobacteria bacterium]
IERKLMRPTISDGDAEINRYIGQKIRLRRQDVGLTQSGLSSFLGITFQQLQKYESGKNRVSASTLYKIAQVLGVEMNFFLEGFGTSKLNDSSKAVYTADAASEISSAQLSEYFDNIRNVVTKRKLFELTRAIASK